MVLAHTYPRKKGEEVVLLIVDDISGVPLIPLLGVPQPDRAGPGLSPTAASQPLTAPAGKTCPQHQGHALLSMFISKASARGHTWAASLGEMGNRTGAPKKLGSQSKMLCPPAQIIYFKKWNSSVHWPDCQYFFILQMREESSGERVQPPGLRR